MGVVPVRSSGHGIYATHAERTAPCEATDAQPGTAKHAPLVDRLEEIVAAGRNELARPDQKRRNDELITSNEEMNDRQGNKPKHTYHAN